MQTITDDLRAILKSKFQAGADGFRARIEIGPVPTDGFPSVLDADMQSGVTSSVSAGTPHSIPYPTNLVAGDLILVVLGSSPPSTNTPALTLPVALTELSQIYSAWAVQSVSYRVADGGEGSTFAVTQDKAGSIMYRCYRIQHYAGVPQIATPGPGAGPATNPGTPVVTPSWGSAQNLYVAALTDASPLSCTHYPDHYPSQASQVIAGSDGMMACAYGKALSASSPNAAGDYFGVTFSNSSRSTVAIRGDGIVVEPTSRRVLRVSPNKSLSTDSDRCEVDLDNSDGAVAIGDVVPNTPARVFAWYGDQENEVQVFSMLVDRVRHTRHPHIYTISGRDWMKKLIVQKLALSASQDEDAEGVDVVRDPSNYVYLGWEISAIVEDLLDKANFPGGQRSITTTSVTVEEFRGNDDEPFAAAISRLGDIVSYLSFADELGVYHFEPNPVGSAGDPDWTYRAGEDIYLIESEEDDDQLYTRVRVSGPMTITETVDAWEEVWNTAVIAHPIGAWYDPADPDNLRVLDSHSKRVYILQQSDQSILSSWYVGGSVAYPLGISGDPADSDRFYILDAPWAFTGGVSTGRRTGNRLLRFKKSDLTLQAIFTLPDGRWSDMKVGAGGDIWLTDYDTNQLWRFDYTTGNPIAGYTIVPANPTGLAIDGDELTVFYDNGKSYVVDESAPTIITRTIPSSPGMWGGEYDTTTNVDLYVVGGGQVWKYTTASVSMTSIEIVAEAVNATLEAELLALTGYAEVRRLQVNLPAILSQADAQATADAMLARASRPGSSLDVGIIGNPGLQKGDKIRVEDPVLGVSSDWQAISCPSDLAGDSGTYLGTLSMKPWVA